MIRFSGWTELGAVMRGSDGQTGSLFSYVNLEARVAADHPLRLIRELVNETLAQLDRSFAKLYAEDGRPSIPPERLLRASLLQLFYLIRSERQLMERLASSIARCPFRVKMRSGRLHEEGPLRGWIRTCARVTRSSQKCQNRKL